MVKLAVIGGSGLDEFRALDNVREIVATTPYGKTSAPIFAGSLDGVAVAFLPRHGSNHSIPPHAINYRANIAALAAHGVTHIIAVTAVGGITAENPPGQIVIPDQIIDYTYDRQHTFFDGADGRVEHIDFTYPFCSKLREQLCAAAKKLGLGLTCAGNYGVTQGPRLETAGEIQRMRQDGCTIVGMTAMPEAALAREAGINYANCSLVVNWAAGTNGEVIDLAQIEATLANGMQNVVALIRACSALGETRSS